MGPIAEQPRPRHGGRSYHNWPPDTLSALMNICSNYPMTSSCRLLDVRGTGLAVPSLLVVVSTASPPAVRASKCSRIRSNHPLAYSCLTEARYRTSPSNFVHEGEPIARHAWRNALGKSILRLLNAAHLQIVDWILPCVALR